ncbi:MAG TPA: N,N-dimethylformamidase beta subunit family domain-containing protein [Actinomycetota bacterium]|nr:N,N-dimethylformamidase beta subunit family domain-containing protein [Actinomycetota bacterium]
MVSRIPRGVLALAGAVAVLGFLIGAGYGLEALFGSPSPAPLPALPGAVRPQPNASANPIVAENAKPGTTAWQIANVAGSAGIEGYADHTSATQGETVTLFVSTRAAHFTVQAYRMGYYGGLGGRLVWTSPDEPGVQQAPAAVQAGTNMATANWKASLSVHIDASWTPGDYLLKLVGDGGQQRYIPLTVIDPSSTAPLVVVNAVTTWEAFNDWGGYNLYFGPNQAAQNRSTVVSFDRPYASAGGGNESGDGSGDFLGDEFPLVYFAESYGLDVTYVTDVDLDEDGAQLLAGRSGVITLGHDEYWSAAMRTAVTGAEDHGVNLAFLGANAMYQQIRLQPSALGPDRQIVDYKNAAADPIAATNPSAVTVPWRDPPVSDPESSVIGELFACNPATPAPAVVVDAGNWLFTDTGIRNGDTFPNLIGPYYDQVNPAFTTPADVEVLAHSPVTCQKVQSYADMTYYSAPSGAGVFATGTTGWVCELTASCLQDPRPHPDLRILQITRNLLVAFASGPAGTAHPSKSNLASLGIAKATP